MTTAMRLWGAALVALAMLLHATAAYCQGPGTSADARIPALPVAPNLPGASPAPQPTPTRRVHVTNIVVEGNTLLPPADIQKIVAPYENRDLTIVELHQAADAITRLYRSRGYLLAHALLPTQEVKAGEVRVLAVEGKIGQIKVEGARHYSSRMLERRVRHVIGTGSLQGQRLQRATLLLNEYPDLSVKAVLKPGAAPETADLILQVQESSPYHVTAEYNNFGTRSTGENRAGLGVEAGNLAGLGDLLLVRGDLGFPSRGTNFTQAGYSLPINADGTRLGVQYVSGAFAVGRELEALNIRGRSNVYGLLLSQALARNVVEESDMSLELDAKDSVTTLSGLGLNHDHYTSITLGYSDDWRGVGTRTVVRGNATQGLDGTSTTDAAASRPGAGATFTRLNADVAYVRTLTPKFYLLLRGNAQWALQPLLLPEQYSLGGPDTVRGYKQAEILGDSAYNVTGELHFSPLKDTELLQLVAFLDHGIAYTRGTRFAPVSAHSLLGTGLGVRVGLPYDTQIRVDLGFPLSPASNLTHEDPVLYASFQARF